MSSKDDIPPLHLNLTTLLKDMVAKNMSVLRVPIQEAAIVGLHDGKPVVEPLIVLLIVGEDIDDIVTKALDDHLGKRKSPVNPRLN